MSLSTLERPPEITAAPMAELPLVSPDLTAPPVETGWSRKWPAAIALGASCVALCAALFSGGENATTTTGDEEPTPTAPAIPFPRRDDREAVPVETPPTLPTQSSVDYTTPPSTPPTIPTFPSDQKADRTAAATSDQQVTTEKPPLPHRQPTPWTEYTTRGR